MNVFKKRLDNHWKTQPFLYDYRAPFVAERIRTTDNFLSQEDQEQSIGEVAWSTEALGIGRYRYNTVAAVIKDTLRHWNIPSDALGY